MAGEYGSNSGGSAGLDGQTAEAEETSPLLVPGPAANSSEARPSPSASPSLYPYALIFIFALSFLTAVGDSLLDTPEVRLLEMAVCRDYYRIHDSKVIGEPPLSYVDEKLCKLGQIQVDTAYIRAIKKVWETIPGILFTIPYGHLSDRVGRRPVLFLGLLGQLLALFWMLIVCGCHALAL